MSESLKETLFSVWEEGRQQAEQAPTNDEQSAAWAALFAAHLNNNQEK
jgi:hypothetical protein